MTFAVKELRDYPVSKVCLLLKLHISTYYDWLRKGVRHAEYTEEDCQAVYNKFVEHHGSFGRRVLKIELAKAKIFMSENKISRIMKQLQLVPKYGRRKGKNVYTSKTTEKYIRENLFAQLTTEEREAKEIWSMDFTEQKIRGKKIYTCGIISVNSKILVGYSQSRKCTTELAVKTVMKAVEEYGVPDMIMTDRGSQFTSKEFYDMMVRLTVAHSMSRPHKPVDNRFIETFWKSMKVELGKLHLLNEAMYRMVVDYYMYYYNNLRPHGTLGYKPPLAA